MTALSGGATGLRNARPILAEMAAPNDGPTREELLRENADLRSQLDDFLFHLPDALVESDLVAERVIYMNRMAQVLFGYTAEDVAQGISGLRALRRRRGAAGPRPSSRPTWRGAWPRAQPYERTGRQDLYELRMRRKDGTAFVAETQSSFVIDEKGVPRRMRSIIRDVTARKEMEARLEEMSHRDPLTGCYNRRHLDRQRDELERPTARWACLVFDLDNFKAINDTYGHEEGDRVLQGFAHFLSRHHRPDDLLVRTGRRRVRPRRARRLGRRSGGVSKRLLEAAALDSPAGFSMGVAFRKPGETTRQAHEPGPTARCTRPGADGSASRARRPAGKEGRRRILSEPSRRPSTTRRSCAAPCRRGARGAGPSAGTGLPGDHHFYLTFGTRSPGSWYPRASRSSIRRR